MENTKTINKVENVEATEEKKPEGFFAKVGGFVKKHGKKIVTVVAVGAVGLAAFALGKNSAMADSSDCYCDDELVGEESEEYSDVE